MASNSDAKCRLCRREGMKLYLKGARCYSPKCPIEKQASPPGQHGPRQVARAGRMSDYGKQLREKQRVKRYYQIRERQMSNYFKKASKDREATGEAMLQLLESRLDSVMYRSGLVASRSIARQLIGHGNVKVDDHRVDVPSYNVKTGQIIKLDDKIAKLDWCKTYLKDKDNTPADWTKRQAISAQLTRLPERKEIDLDINEQLVVEFYSR